MSKPATHSRLTATVLKAMGLFSGLQVVSILCSIVKMKLVALWLHASGVGLFGIYQTVIETIATLSDLGLRQSTVRDIARTHTQPSRLAVMSAIVRRWSALAGLLGAVIILGASPLLSQWFFHTPAAPWGFILLSCVMLLNSLTAGEQALLQGTSRLKALARAGLIGTLAGLAVSIPLFRFMGEKSVALSIVAYAVAMYLAARYYRLRTPRPSQAISLRTLWTHGASFARLGLCMALAAFIGGAAHTILVALINAYAGTAALGYVQAGDTVIIKYIGLIFTAIGMEFYPRLAAVAHNSHSMRTYVNHEVSLLLLILTPLLLLFIMLREVVVELLYTPDFLMIIPLITWGALSAIPKATAWCMAFSIISRGAGKTYILTEALDAIVSVPLCYFSYVAYGLEGLGIAYIAWYLVYLLITLIAARRVAGVSLSQGNVLLSLLSGGICVGGIYAAGCLPAVVAWPLLIAAAGAFVPPLYRLIKK